jgi:hypothetical protein
MNLTDLSVYLKSKFDLENPRFIMDEKVICHTYDFQSDILLKIDNKNNLFKLNLEGTDLERGEKENQNFRYAIFSPNQKEKFSEAIIMLHGLNERNWNKYLPWAYHLVLQTNKPVILFPIAYHMNRSPVTWICPRKMDKFTVFRKSELPSVENSSFVNVAISLRMDNYPELFAMSGIQTYFDIIKLSAEIKSGNSEIFEKDCKINFFAYSIGALLTQILLISNPLRLFSDSKAFFFCGGTTFDKIHGSSRSIMDSIAFDKLRNYLLNNKIHINTLIESYKQNEQLLKEGWKAFLAMSGIKKYVNQRKAAFNRLTDRIKAIGLQNDFVIPANAILETFMITLKNRYFDIDIMDFPFKYSHETPFPVNNNKILDTVNNSFVLVFDKASKFLR